jgi:hypothetical protein
MGDWKWDKKERQRQKKQQAIVAKLRSQNAVVAASAIEAHLSASEKAAAQSAINNPDATLLDEFKNLAKKILEQQAAANQPYTYYFNTPTWPTVTWSVEDKPKPDPLPLPEETVVAAVEGFRCWIAPMFADELRSMNNRTVWPKYRRLESECSSDQCIGIDCGCGIYAFKALDRAMQDFSHKSRYSNRVFGCVSLWGRVLECETGYRAQFAYPKSIVDTGTLARKIAAVYGVPLTMSKLI